MGAEGLGDEVHCEMRAILGPERRDAKVAEVLGRTIKWREEEMWYEADPRHVERMLEDMDMETCSECVTPGSKGPQKRKMKKTLTPKCHGGSDQSWLGRTSSRRTALTSGSA